jgi:hypothetical protein
MTYQLFWGDLHSHCSISYGHGSAEQALIRARQQLDFCSITGHAFWPDMPTDRERYAEIIDYHNAGFATLGKNWDRLLSLEAEATEEESFIAFPSYEWHSLEFGDHNVYSAAPQLPLKDADDLPGLREVCRTAKAIAIPHHIGYASGYRGIDWEAFREELSPFVEVFSLHGCSVDDRSPYPMLHDMGPRDAGSTAEAGWARGHRFGIVGGTDHHGAYPGSHGDGRMGVFAKDLTRESLWEAFQNRRVFAATGDRIDARLFVEEAWIGESIQHPGSRHLKIQVHAADAIDKVELLKNGRVIQRFFPEPAMEPQPPFRLSITWGWGRKDRLATWRNELTLSEGDITGLETCFSGQAVVAPKSLDELGESPDDVDLPHEVLEHSNRRVVWRSITSGNLTMRHATTQQLRLTIDAPLSAAVIVESNGIKYRHSLEELLAGGRTHYQNGWLMEAIKIGPLVPLSECRVNAEWIDPPERETDDYRLQVAQQNGQWAWLSPIWVER